MSLSEPHIDHDNGPACGIMPSIYLCQYVSFTPHLLHPSFQDPWRYALKCSVYSRRYNYCQDTWTARIRALSTVKIVDKDR